MRQLRYSVAASLDGYIAGRNGEYDWIPIDPDVDFEAMYRRFSGIVMGRRSYEIFVSSGGPPPGISLPTWVYSRSLPEGERDGVIFVNDASSHLRELKKEDGRPLWLWGGGVLFGELAAAGLVDGIDVAVIPIVLGGGIPLTPPPTPRTRLQLRKHTASPKTGTLFLEYDVVRS